MDEHSTLKIDNMSVKFCGKNVDPPSPMSYCLPVMIHQCPDDFSTLDYFDVSFEILWLHRKITENRNEGLGQGP